MTVTSIKQAQFTKKAAEIVRRFRNLKDIEKTLEADKLFLREYADGETLTHDVPGLGSIQVKKPSEGSSGVSLVFNEESYKLLDEPTKQKLIKAGVVTSKTWTKSPSLAAVVITLNK